MPDSDQHDLAEFESLDSAPDIRLIATDMDGTLLDDEKTIHEEFWPLIDQLHARGVTFCPASGRQYYSLRRQFEAIANEVVFIAENGTYVVNGADGTEISSDCLPLSQARELVAAAREVPHTGTVLCGKKSAYIESTDESFLAEVHPYYANLERVDDLLAITNDEILKVAIYDYVSAELNVGAALAGYRESVQVVVSGAHWLDMMALTANKGNGLRHVQALLGVTPAQTVVFGDFLNDAEMMDAADYSFAMANAHPDLKARATYRAPANTANGVVRTIRTVMRLS